MLATRNTSAQGCYVKALLKAEHQAVNGSFAIGTIAECLCATDRSQGE